MDQDSTILRADARGRLQLPKDLQHHKFFELIKKDGQIILFPMKVERLPETSAERASEVWLNKEVSEFIKSDLAKTFNQLKSSSQKLGIQAVVLFGSRARGEALTGSDFDLAVFCTDSMTRSKRELFSEHFEEGLKKEFSKLRRHGVHGELSISFIPLKLIPQTPPSLYFSVATEGLLFWQSHRCFDDWKARVKKVMNRIEAKLEVSGKVRTWRWKS